MSVVSFALAVVFIINFPLFVENVMRMLDGCFLHIIATTPLVLR